jgi:hypothetical protein
MYFARVFISHSSIKTLNIMYSTAKNVSTYSWLDDVNKLIMLSFGILQWQDTHAEFPKFSFLPFIFSQNVIILELAPRFLFGVCGVEGGHRNAY